MRTMKNGLIKNKIRGEVLEAWNVQIYKRKSENILNNLVKDEPVNCSSHSDKEKNIGEIPDAKQQELH